MLCRKILNLRSVAAILDIAPSTRNLRNIGERSVPSMTRLFTVDTRSLTIGEIVEKWSHRFENEGISEPVESIEHIVAHVIGTTKLMDVTNSRDNCLTASQSEHLESLCECRLSRMPVQYIIGEWDFRDITLKLVPPVFIPRPETEILVDFVLKRLRTLPAETRDVLEVGCGSGAISLALAHSCNKVKSIAIDTSVHACELTTENRDNLNLQERVTVVHATLQEDGNIECLDDSKNAKSIDFESTQFDFIVSNPPYVPTKKVMKLAPEIKIYEDLRALDGGEDGLKVVRPLLKYAAKALKPGGGLFMEIDPGHPEYISFFTKKYFALKLEHRHTYKDYCNNDRFVEIIKVS